ncbi:SRPBCC domain-containing protein [Phenylobacterium sp.]|uniref:SRPBCC family protein n=1 Tax=Phenylobacterium sp. TaxID=1871053 RepID=UPI0025D01A87|nr:SRPBCC domain-containing protein [Phenylobacterium sp.]
MPVLKSSLEIDAPAIEVWRVLTSPELVREWAAAYQDGLHIRTSWREGEPVAWRTQEGDTRAEGRVAAFKPQKLLKFEYASDEGGSFPDTFEIVAKEDRTWLNVTTGPLGEEQLNALKGPTEEAIKEIKSLAEESAQIHGLRR